MDFMYNNLILLLLFPLLLLFIFLSKARKSSDLKLPPSPPKLPIIGNLHQLVGSTPPHHRFRKLAKKYGPIYGLKLGQVNIVVISSPTILKEIVFEHDLNFSGRPLVPSMKEVTYNYKNLTFAPYGPYWRQLRKITTLELFTTKRVKSFQAIREEEVNRLIDEIRTSHEFGMIINLTKEVYKVTNQIVCRAALGKAGGNERLLKGIREALDLSSGLNLADFFPSLDFVNALTGVRAKMVRIYHELDEFYNEVLKEHRAKNHDGSGEDLVDVLLRVQRDQYDSGSGEEALGDSSIKANITDMFVAGTDTAATTIIWAMSELMKNPRVMNEAQTEVRSTLHGKTRIEESDINKLNYLKLVIKETFRLHPPTPLLLPREAIDSCTVNGYHIPAKSRIIVNAWAVSRDPTYWADAEQFQPERFRDGVDFKGHHMEFTPFGWGRRGCPGMNFGVAVIEIVLAQLLACFDWKMPNGTNTEDLNMEEKFGLVSTRKDDLCLVAVPFAQISN